MEATDQQNSFVKKELKDLIELMERSERIRNFNNAEQKSKI